jgi:hypothetical protein
MDVAGALVPRCGEVGMGFLLACAGEILPIRTLRYDTRAIFLDSDGFMIICRIWCWWKASLEDVVPVRPWIYIQCSSIGTT